MNEKCGIVVPTLGLRSEYLEQCLRSIRDAGDCHICIVAPQDVDLSKMASAGLMDQRVDDLGEGLAQSINLGLRSLPDSIKYINWLGDDDLLAPLSLNVTSQFLNAHPDVIMVFGSCDYIDSEGEALWKNVSGQWAIPLLRFGPCLIPQPGALFRADAYERVGGLRSDFKWAFDFELFIRFSKIGSIRYISQTLASFRWHNDSLSVGGRHGSVLEASKARSIHLPVIFRLFSFIWEFPVRFITKYAGNFIGLPAATSTHK
jgi:hypothetical protein